METIGNMKNTDNRVTLKKYFLHVHSFPKVSKIFMATDDRHAEQTAKEILKYINVPSNCRPLTGTIFKQLSDIEE